MDKSRLILYQINPRMFTPQGTLRAAKALLPHIASIGVNVVYLFSVCKEDDSEDRAFWSERQKKSNLNNPKNPYRIADYFSVDEEYGGNAQLKEFVEEAHKVGLSVMMDLVYFHCAPDAMNAVMTDWESMLQNSIEVNGMPTPIRGTSTANRPQKTSCVYTGVPRKNQM